MNRHLSQDILIQYIFNLAEDGKSEFSKADIARHLGECKDCAAMHDQLKAKFATLDTLNGEVKASETLIAKTIANAKSLAKPRRNRFFPPTWMCAVAAVLLVGTLAITIFQFNKAGTTSPANIGGGTIAKSANPARVALPVSEVKTFEKAYDFSNPPFAPASAIELNVLPKKESTQITIYNSADLTLVREKRKLTLKRGWNWLQFMWANTLIDPTSLSLEPTEQKGKVRIEQLVYPARLKDIGRWLIASEIEGQVEFEITYFISGVSWRAFYMGTLSTDESKMHLQGYVRVTNNSGEDYKDASVRLIVGKVNLLDHIAELSKRQWPYSRPGWPVIIDDRKRNAFHFHSGEDTQLVVTGITSSIAEAGRYIHGFKKKKIIKEGLSEYFLYTIEGKETILNTWSKRLPSLDVEDIPVVNLYKYEEEMYQMRVMRFLSFKNDEEHELGETPIPGGAIKVYRNLADSHLSYESSSSFKYIPVNEKVELNLGEVQNVVVKPTLMSVKTKNYRYNRRRDISGWDEIQGWKMEIKNTRDIPIEIEIKRNFHTNYWDIETKQKYEKFDKDTIKIKLKLKPGENKTFQYTLTKRHGDNQRNR